MAGILNYAYAAHWSYDFRIVLPQERRGGSLKGDPYPGWHKVQYLLERLSNPSADERRCKWLLYMDSDAFVRMHDLPMDIFLAGLVSRYWIREDVGVIFAREQNLTGANAEPPKADFLNTGVLFVRFGERSKTLFERWLAAGFGVESRRLWNLWPGEQGIISEHLLPGSYPQAKSSIERQPSIRNSFAAVNLTEFNSPWGRFVQHNYGKTANDQTSRDRAFREALLRLDCLEAGCFTRLRRAATKAMERWTPAPIF